jgi:hypothetical protein
VAVVQYTFTHKQLHRTTQITINLEECGPCPLFASFTLAFALQLRKKRGKTSVRVKKTSVRLYQSNGIVIQKPGKFSPFSISYVHVTKHKSLQLEDKFIFSEHTDKNDFEI